MAISHYDNKGKKIGESKDSDDLIGEGIGILIIISGIFYFISEAFLWVNKKMNNWESLEIPYSYIFSFYHYLIQIPIEFLSKYTSLLFDHELTKYPNLNTIISVVIFTTVIIAILFLLKRVLSIIGLKMKNFILLLILPSLLGGSFFILMKTYTWLTAM